MRVRSHLWQANVLWSPDGPGATPVASSSPSPSPSPAPSSTPSPSPGPTPSASPSPSSSAPGPKGASLDQFRGTTNESVPSADGTSYDFMNEIFGAQPQSPAPSQAEPLPASGQEPVQAPAPAQQPQEPAQQQPQEPSQQQPPASEQQGGTQGQPTPQQASQGPRYNPADPIGLANALREPENYAQALEHLSQTVFKLSEKDLQDLETDVAGTVPRLLARAVLHSQIQTLSVLGHIAPLMMQNHNVLTQKQGEATNNFYQAWPQIDRQKHGRLVDELGVRYRQMNPGDTAEQMIERLGPFVLMQLGLPMAAMTRPGQPAAAPQLRAPATNGSRAPQQVAFQPASPGAVVHQQQVPDDQYGYMGNRGD